MREIKINVIDCFYLLICTAISSWYFLPTVKETVAPMYIVLLGLVVLGVLIQYKRIETQETLLFFVALFVISLQYFLVSFPFNTNKAIGIITQLFVSTIPAIVFCLIKQRKHLLKPFCIILTILIAFVFIKTFYEMIVTPEIARILAHGDTEEESLREYRLQNLGGFGHSYGAAFLAGVFFHKCMDKTAKHRFWNFVLFAFLVSYVFNTQYFLALFVIGFLVISCLYTRTTSTKRFLYLFVGALCLFLLPTIFNFFSQITEGTLSLKFKEIADSVTSGSVIGSSSTARIEVYLLSLSQFVSSPIIGTRGNSVAYSIIGGHSTFFDFMALSGIIGLAVYILVLRFTKNIINLNKTFYKSIFVVYIILGILNPTMNMYELSGFIFLYIPLLFALLEEQKNRNLN